MEFIIGKEVIIFILCSLINVILSTMKSILTVKSTKGVATLINAITYGFYTIVIKQISSIDASITVAVTIGTNLVGVYFSMWLLDKLKKDKLWKVCVTTKNKTIIPLLEEQGISYSFSEVFTMQHKKYYSIDIFSPSQRQSEKIAEILKTDEDVRYHVVEVKNL